MLTSKLTSKAQITIPQPIRVALKLKVGDESTAEPQEAHGLIWVAMITSAENRAWDSDVTVSNLSVAGLPAPSVIRAAKIATIDGADASLT